MIPHRHQRRRLKGEATLPFGSVAVEAEANERGERHVRLERTVVSRLRAIRAGRARAILISFCGSSLRQTEVVVIQ
jgi:hypothetical protein